MNKVNKVQDHKIQKIIIINKDFQIQFGNKDH